MLELVFIPFLFSLIALMLSWGYFRHVSIQRPPIGVINLSDVVVMMGSILIIPFLYLWLPVWLLGALLVLSGVGITYFGLEPLISYRPILWSIVFLLIGADLLALSLGGADSRAFLFVNNLVQLVVILSISNLWAQSGMKARDSAVLAGFLVGYDLLFTAVLPMMSDLFNRLDGLPLAPLVAWTDATGGRLAIGLGDLLLAAVFPLLLRKAYSRRAGVWALCLAAAILVLVFILPALGMLQRTFPVMIVLGPLMVIQYLFWRSRHGAERTTAQFLQAEPRNARFFSVDPDEQHASQERIAGTR